jgi:hypothetical protein
LEAIDARLDRTDHIINLEAVRQARARAAARRRSA